MILPMLMSFGMMKWILFRKPVAAATARKFGLLLLDKGASTINLKSFRYYDRMYPSQDVANSIGNLIALPLQTSGKLCFRRKSYFRKR